MKCILKYPGAKNRIANWICEFIPAHQVYVEPYFGSGAVFFNKMPTKIETLNDLDDNVVNYFRVMREHPEKLAQILSLTPYSRTEYEKSYIVCDDDSDMEKARKFAVRCWMGFGCTRYKNGFRSSQQTNSPRITKAWREFPDRIISAGDRLMNAQIENLPAIELIKRYNTHDVFIYADPPYLSGTRKGYLYKHEMTDKDHVLLLEALLEHPGKILLSGYDNDMYNNMLYKWNKVQRKTQAEHGLVRTETLWMNYEIGQVELKLFY